MDQVSFVFLCSSGSPPGREAVNGVSWKEHWIKEPDLNIDFFCYKKKIIIIMKKEQVESKVSREPTANLSPLCSLQDPFG